MLGYGFRRENPVAQSGELCALGLGLFVHVLGVEALVRDRGHERQRQCLVQHAPARVGDQALELRVANHHVFQQAQQQRLFEGIGS